MTINLRLPAALIAAGLSFNAWAEADSRIENLVTTAHRTPLPPAQLGSAVSVVSREQIERRQAVLITDLLQDLPGITVSRAGGPGSQSQLRLRGAESNHVLVLIDGMAANDPAAADEFSFEQLTAWDVERLEVVRGPQSAIWGSDAMAGVINVITRQPTGEAWRSRAFVEGGSLDTLNLGGRLGGQAGRLRSALSASWLDSDGENISRSGDEADGYENLTTSLNLALEATEGLQLGLSARRTDSRNDFDSAASGLPTDAELRSEVELSYLQGHARLELLDDRWQQQLRISYTDSARENSAAGAFTNRQEGLRYGVDYQTSWDFTATADEYRLTLAVDHDAEEFQQRYPAFGGQADQDQRRDRTGYVVELLSRPWRRLNLNASLRYDDNSDFDDKATYRLSGSYRFETTGTRLHASYGTGLKQPTFTELYGFFPDFFTGNPELRPEESKGGDIGVEQIFWDERARLDLTWFYAELTDEIATVFAPLSTAVNLDGVSRRHGLEAALELQITAGLIGTASYTYIDSREPDGADGKRREIRRPRHMAALNLDYRFWAERAGLNLNLSYTGEQRDDVFLPPGFARETVTLDEYTLVNLAASYALSDSLTLYARAENLFDADYENLFGYRMPGVGYYAGVRLDVR